MRDARAPRALLPGTGAFALREFWESHPDAEQSLRPWYATASRARWKRPSDVKDDYRNASFIANNRVVFNIKGNTYRLLLAMRYDNGIGFVRFVGTHAAYDRIEAETI